jgi:hypothetical protein
LADNEFAISGAHNERLRGSRFNRELAAVKQTRNLEANTFAFLR